ncbi:MAG: MBL fold metallo-hydrolase, partial [Clostridia bacterium]
VGHHGSADASRDEFLRRVGADLAAISVGGNAYGLPDPETMARLQSRTAVVLTTREHGAVMIESDGRQWKAAAMAAPLPGREVP